MKKLILLITIFSAFTFVEANAQDYIQLLKSAQYEELGSHFNHKIKIEFDRDKKTLSKEKAISLLKSKLEAFDIVKWETMHKGSSDTADASYLITKAFNAEGKGLRIFIHLENVNGRKTISAIRVRDLL